MNWSFLVVAFCLAVLSGAIAATTLAQMRPQWSERRRRLVAASLLPAATILLTLAAIVYLAAAAPGEGETMTDLAVTVTAMMGGVFAVMAFVGGIIGAALLQRRTRR